MAARPTGPARSEDRGEPSRAHPRPRPEHFTPRASAVEVRCPGRSARRHDREESADDPPVAGPIEEPHQQPVHPWVIEASGARRPRRVRRHPEPPWAIAGPAHEAVLSRVPPLAGRPRAVLDRERRSAKARAGVRVGRPPGDRPQFGQPLPRARPHDRRLRPTAVQESRGARLVGDQPGVVPGPEPDGLGAVARRGEGKARRHSRRPARIARRRRSGRRLSPMARDNHQPWLAASPIAVATKTGAARSHARPNAWIPTSPRSTRPARMVVLWGKPSTAVSFQGTTKPSRWTIP